MNTRVYQSLLMLLLAVGQAVTHAEDIDLFYVPTDPSSSANAPSVLLVMDNGAGFSSNAAGHTCFLGTPSTGTAATGTAVETALSGKSGGIEQCALFNVIQGMSVTAVAKVKIGIMMYKGVNVRDYLGNPCSGNADGGCLVYPITDLNLTTKVPLLNWIKSWTISGGAGPGYVKAAQADGGVGASMHESWAYFTGKTGMSGTDYAGIAPVTGCSKNFVVFVGNAWGANGNPSDHTSVADALNGVISPASKRADPVATTVEKTLIAATTANRVTACGTINFPASNQHEASGFYADEWARYMTRQSITTYTIGLLGAGCQPEYPWILNSMATYGGGKYFPTSDYTTLKTAFETILSEVQSVNSVFAAVSLPVSVNTQGTYLNQVFVGMFRPDADSLPNWLGNLKQYKMGYVNSVFRLLDADGAAAISSSGSDFIAECARSFWTPSLTAPDDYWSAMDVPNCSSYPATSNTPDGNMVEKGGQGYMLRATSPATRTVKTCPAGGCASLSNFTTAAMGSGTVNSDATLQNTLINWSRGQNSKGEVGRLNGVDLTLTDMRPSVHGDVVHSRPIAINFGTDASPRVTVFYGGNDGLLRAINGNRTELSGTVTAGSELWSFMPAEFYGKIKRRYDNTEKVLTPTIAGTPKDYGMDGPVAGYIDTATSNPAWIYAGMRRGGRGMYAFAIDRTTLAPSAKWKVGCDSAGCTSGFSGIGQTWATPTVFKASGYGAGTSPLLIMGGGYDAACEDTLTYTCGATTTGNHIYVMDADTGALLKTFDTYRGVTGDILMLRDSNGFATYGYATDLGGDVYRISGSTPNAPIGATAPGSWTITKLAMLGCDTLVAQSSLPATSSSASSSTNCVSPPNRKFLYGPDVVVEGTTHYILVGTGNRERPLDTANATQNHFFMLKDQPTVTTWLSDENARCNQNNVLCMASLAAPVVAGNCAAVTDTSKGWALQLRANEQVVTSAITAFGVSYFSTHEPKVTVAGVCTPNLGTARAYAVAYATAGSPNGCSATPYTTLTAGGLPPSPVAGNVKLDDGSIVPFVIGAVGPLEATKLIPPAGTSTNPSTKIKSYWYIKK